MKNVFDEENKREPLKWWDKVRYIFTNPNEAFKDVAVFPKVLFPTLLVVISMILISLITLDKDVQIQNMIQQYEKLGQEIPPTSQMEKSFYVSILFAGIGPLIFWGIKSFLVSGLSSVLGGTGTVKEAFSVIAHAYLPVVLGSLVVGIISMIVGKGTIPIDFSILLPNSMEGGFLYYVLAQINIFIIWYEILTVIGISYAFDIPRKKSAIVVIGSWLIWILIVSGTNTIISSYTQGLMG